MAAFNRPSKATYEIHETVRVDTHDNEDHTFCGIMFPIKAKEILPIECVVIRSIAVRGQLGPITVWVTNKEEETPQDRTYRFRLSSRHWTKIYQQEHKSSYRTYKTLDLGDNPIVIRPGHTRAVYIHSTIQGDEAIVYDNSRLVRGRPRPRYQDSIINILSGKAHLSGQPFGQTPIWGWGNAWRDHREFVGQIEYGTVYKLWNPDIHCHFGEKFRKATLQLLLGQRCCNTVLQSLPDECLFYILNMCRWDWFDDNQAGMKVRRMERKRRHRLLELQQEEEEKRQKLQAQQCTPKNGCCGSSRKPRAANTEENDKEYDAEDEDGHVDDDESTGGDEEDTGDRTDAARYAAAVPPQREVIAIIGDTLNALNDPSSPASAVGAALASEEDDAEPSDESEWEHANGYRAENTVFTYRDVSTDEEEVERLEQAPSAEDRQAWLRRNLARIHILRAIAMGEQDRDLVDV